MHSLHVYHTRRFHDFFHTDMWRFDLSIWLHIIARSSISIFIPIFLLELGYSLIAVLSFYLLVRLVDVPLNFVAAQMIKTIGARKIYLVSTFAIIAFFSLFSQLQVNDWYLFLALIILISIYDACYWVSHLYLFEKVSHKVKDISKGTGALYAVKYLAGMMGPFIGAGVLYFATPKILMAVSVTIFIISTIPMFRMKLEHEKPSSEEVLLSPKKLFSKPEERKNYLSVALYGLHRTSEGVIWPIFIYLTFKSIESVAFVPIIISITSMIFSYIAGKFARNNREKIIAIGALLIASVWFLRLFTQSNQILYLSVFLVSFFALFISVSLYSNVFARGRKIGMLTAVTYNNAISMAAQSIVYILLIFVLTTFKLSFVVAAVALFALTAVNSLFALASNAKKG